MAFFSVSFAVMPEARRVKDGKRVEKGGSRQRKPTLCSGKAGEGWEEGGQKVEVVRESPPYAQASR